MRIAEDAVSSMSPGETNRMNSAKPQQRKPVAVCMCADDGVVITTVLADDGTMWWTSDDMIWNQLPDLPTAEEVR